MKRMTLIFFLVALSAPSAYASMTGQVVDAETGRPIEGAIVLVEWTINVGIPGLMSTESYEVVESVTDKDGRISIARVLHPLINPPQITIYKKGYVAWNNEFIFPDYKPRKDFQWRDNYVFKMDRFRPEYSYDKHTSFIHGAIHSGIDSDKKILIKTAIEWEEMKSFEERMRNRPK